MSQGLSRRTFPREFKLSAIQRLEMEASVAELARAFEGNPNVLHSLFRCVAMFALRDINLTKMNRGPGAAGPGNISSTWTFSAARKPPQSARRSPTSRN